ncbi:MAG: ABC transporter ATP-binding protein [Gaiellaceae bacterium]
MTAAVEVHEAYRIYDSGARASVALQGLSLVVEPGEIVVALGPSGSGKTTLLRAVAGLERLSAGSVTVFGSDLGQLKPKDLATFRAESVGFLEQHYSRALSADLSCRQNVALQLGLLGHELSHAGRVADELLDRVGLSDRRNDRPEALSGGEQQRVAVCAAVAHRPRLLLVDEPVGELDAANAATIYELLGELAREVGASALIVSHDDGAGSIADRLVQIRDGRVVEEGVPGRVSALVISRGGWIRLPSGGSNDEAVGRLISAERQETGFVLSQIENGPLSTEVVSEDISSRDTGTVPEAEETVAELRGLSKSYRAGGAERVVLSDLSYAFKEGRLVVVLGRSGCGKTTLLHLLAGLERPSAGEVSVLDELISRKSRPEVAAFRRRAIALVAQEPGLVPHLSALENVQLTLTIRNEEAMSSRARAALEDVGLGEKLDQRARSMSAGERQRVAIARAIAADVRLLLVDEPTGRLDEENGRAIGHLLARTASARGLAVVCATHDPVVIDRADEVIDLGRRVSA